MAKTSGEGEGELPGPVGRRIIVRTDGRIELRFPKPFSITAKTLIEYGWLRGLYLLTVRNRLIGLGFENGWVFMRFLSEMAPKRIKEAMEIARDLKAKVEAEGRDGGIGCPAMKEVRRAWRALGEGSVESFDSEVCLIPPEEWDKILSKYRKSNPSKEALELFIKFNQPRRFEP